MAAATLLFLACVAAYLILLPHPTGSKTELAQMASDAHLFMQEDRSAGANNYSSSDLPRSLAALEPEFVKLTDDGLYLTIVPFFDGGWGYFFAREGGVPAMPPNCVKKLARDVYWWSPC